MADIASAPWFPVLTLLIGYGTKSLSDWIQHKRAVSREREARQATRNDKQAERRTEFQRQTLLELQEATHDMGRYTARIHLADERAYRADKDNWRKQMLPDEISEGLRESQAKVALLVARVRDDEVRKLTTEFKHLCGGVAFVMDIEAARRAFAAMNDLYDRLNERIGTIVRDIDKMEV